MFHVNRNIPSPQIEIHTLSMLYMNSFTLCATRQQKTMVSWASPCPSVLAAWTDAYLRQKQRRGVVTVQLGDVVTREETVSPSASRSTRLIALVMPKVRSSSKVGAITVAVSRSRHQSILNVRRSHTFSSASPSQNVYGPLTSRNIETRPIVQAPGCL